MTVSKSLETLVSHLKTLGWLLSVPIGLSIGYAALEAEVWSRIGAPEAWYFPLSVMLVVAISLFALAISYFFRRESRLEQPDHFVIRSVDRKSLIGRDKDVDDLRELVRFNRLVLLDGESGCGKSALVAAGLRPELADDPAWLPVLLRSWGSDWEAGPLGATIDALFEALGDDGRVALGWTHASDLTAPPDLLATELEEKLAAVHKALGRRPLLLFDQFDDYQAAHRERVLGDDGAWLAPAGLEAANRFWKTVADALRSGAIHAVIVTRDDASGGLHSIRFEGVGLAARTLRRVEAIQIRPMLAALTPKGATPPVVSHPDCGWTDLSDAIAREFEARGALLMQQFRVVLLGLRELRGLTLRRFRSAGNAQGVEALYVQHAVKAAAAGGGRVAEQTVRELLDRLVDRGDGRAIAKTHTIAEPELVGYGPDADARRAMLAVLAEREVARRIVQPGAGSATWRLDHDYLARAVLADARNANRWAVRLADGHAAFESARGSLAQQFRALLGAAAWIRIGTERVRGRLRLGGASRYFWLSALRPALVLALIGAAGAGSVAYLREQEAARTASAIGSGNDYADDLLRVWSGPEWLRNRVRARLEANGNEGQFFNALRVGWVNADIAWEPRRAAALASEFAKRLAETGGSPEIAKNHAGTYAEAYAAVASGIKDQATLKSVAATLRGMLSKPGTDGSTPRVVAQAYAAVASRISDQATLKSEAVALRSLLSKSGTDGSAATAYTAVASRIGDQATLKSEAAALRGLLSKPGTNGSAARVVTQSYTAVASRISDQATLKFEAATLRGLLSKSPSDRVTGYAQAYAAIASRISDQATLKSEAVTLRGPLSKAGSDVVYVRGYTQAYAAVASRINDQATLRSEAATLRGLLLKTGSYYTAQAYIAVASRMSDQATLKAEAAMLRGPLLKASSDGVTGYAPAYAAVASRISDEATLKTVAATLRGLLSKDSSFDAQTSAQAYAAVASRISEQATLKSEAAALRGLLSKPNSPIIAPYAQAYAAVARRISDQATLKSEATQLRGLLSTADPFDVADYAATYAAIASRISDQATLKSMAATLRGLLSKDSSFDVADHIPSYAAVASRIKDQATLKSEATQLRGLLSTATFFDATAFAEAYAAVAGRISEQATLKSEAVALRSLLSKPGSGNRGVTAYARAYTAVASRIKDQATLKFEATTVRGLLSKADTDVFAARGYAAILQAEWVSDQSPQRREAIVREALTYAALYNAGNRLAFLKLAVDDCRVSQPAAICDPLAEYPQAALAWAEKKYRFDRSTLRPSRSELGLGSP